MSAACPVFGFIVRIDPARGLAIEAVLGMLRTQLLESRGLVATVLDPSHGEIVITGDGFQASDADRDAIVGWLDAQPLVASYAASQLGDVGHAA